jgi:hypothetical protein
MVKIIIILILWFFILNGAIVVSKICLWAMRQSDITYILTGGLIMGTVWFFIINEARQTIKKINK